MDTNTLISHPAQRALADALAATGGRLDESQVGVAASIYDATLRSRDPGPFLQTPWYGHRADKPIYPASVIKLFFLDALAAFREMGIIAEDEEDDRAAAQMMAISSNEATVYLVGRLTGADDGACLQGKALEDWCAARHRVQQWYDSQNRVEFAGINVLHGTYEDSPYGRAKQIRNGRNGNLLTPLAGAALLHDIARNARPRSKWMMELMNREFQRHPNDAEPEGDQVRGFLVEGLPPEVMTWSKGGHTSWTRHDLVYGETPDGKSFVLFVMCDSKWAADDKSFLPTFAKRFHEYAFQSQA